MPASAASVAAELLAFHREPVVHRPRYLHGQQPLPAGHVVLRFALGRFPHGWSRDFPRAGREEVRVAALEFVRQVCLWDRASHYQLLCVAAGADRDAIRENYHLLIALIHPDRQEAGAPAWPAGSAQRVNQAYATLSDAARRADYDASLKAVGDGIDSPRPPEGANVARHRRARAGAGVASLAKRAALLAGVVATLFVVQSWWVGSLKPEYSLLERTLPPSARWSGASADSPRFLGPAPFQPGARLEPLQEPKRTVAMAAWVPIPIEGHAPEPVPDKPRAMLPSAPVVVASAGPTPLPAALRASPALAASPVPAPPRTVVVAAEVAAPARVAQAAAPAAPASPAPGPDTPSRDQVEGVVALLVGFYDAGDGEHLVGLVDPDSLGWLQGYRMRSAYADFFAATRTRKLRMERLAWRNNGSVAEARGEATVLAEYNDGRPRLERRVPIEIDIAVRGGAPRITRLVLFPAA